MCQSFRERHGGRAHGKHGIRNPEPDIKIEDVFRVLRTIIGQNVIYRNRVLCRVKVF